MPPIASPFLTPVPPFMRWMGGLTAMNVVGLSTKSGPTGTMGSDVTPWKGPDFDGYA